MKDIEDFLRVHRSKLLRYLDGEAPSSSAEPGPLQYVDQVLEQWSLLVGDRALDTPRFTERTFWFALYQLEELVENPVQGEIDPYEGILLENLAEARELLRDWRALPDKYYATRPGEY